MAKAATFTYPAEPAEIKEHAVRQLAMASAAIFFSGGGYGVAGPAGEWRIADGSANVAISACGGDLCGHVSWARDGGMIGKPVLINMKPSGDAWAGLIVNARDGQRYAARISLRGEGVLKVQGCVLGGLICGGQQWTRLK